MQNSPCFCWAITRKTEPGINWSTSVFAVSKQNLILLLHRGKMESRRRAASQTHHAMMTFSARRLPEGRCQSLNCVLRRCFSSPCVHLWKRKEQHDGAARTQWQIFASPQHIVNHQSALFWQKQTRRHTQTQTQCDAHFMLFTCAICHIFSEFFQKRNKENWELRPAYFSSLSPKKTKKAFLRHLLVLQGSPTTSLHCVYTLNHFSAC